MRFRASALLLGFAVAVLQGAKPATAPTFARDIAPILYGNCATCHRPGQAGPFPLLNYADAKKHATQIADVTGRHYMPPWPPEEGFGNFQDERRLTTEQIATIAAWVKAGEPEGTVADEPAPLEFPSDWQLGIPDLILTAAAPYLVAAGGPDVFWNFTFHPDLKKTVYVRAIEIRPGLGETARLVHHANLLVDRTGSIRRSEAVPGAGFPGMELTLDRSPFDPESHFLFWKPGNVPLPEPDGMSWRLDPGNGLVLNTHLQPSGRPETVRPSIALYFTDKAPTLFPLLIQLENDRQLDIPAGQRDFVIADDFRLPADSDVLAVYPHAHYLGKLLEGYATLPNGTRTWLVKIPDWDLNWQAVYRYKLPVFLPAGSVISMRYHYDNSAGNPRNPNRPPKRVMAGNRASDEMGHLWLQVLPRGRGDRRREIEEALMKQRIEKDPGDFSAHLNLGALMLSRLQTQEAITTLQTAVKLDPKRPEAHDMLGSALRSVGRSIEAAGQFQSALRCDPGYVDARYNLAVTLARAGRFAEAVPEMQRVVQAFPESARLRNELGEMLAKRGDLTEALAQFGKAMKLDPADKTARENRDWAEQEITKRTQN